MKKVLLTSSSKTFLGRNINLLMDKGFQLFTAASGLEAIKMQQKYLFDLILSDLELEDMDGCRLCSEVRRPEHSQSVPVVLICYDTTECMERVKQSDAAAVLVRPINPTQLLVTIGSYIDMQLARAKRVAFNVEVLAKKQNMPFVCISHDISVTGILLETEQQLSLGELLSCDFRVYDSSQGQVEGEVARCISSPKGRMLYGIRFVRLPMLRRSAIEKYVAENDHLGIMLKPYHPLERRVN